MSRGRGVRFHEVSREDAITDTLERFVKTVGEREATVGRNGCQ